jgi:hypothetical protein
MAKAWTKDELQQLLVHATPIVRKFLKGLAARGSATAEEIGVHHMAAAIGYRYAKSRGKDPLYATRKDAATKLSVFTIDPKYRAQIASFLANFKEPAKVEQPKRGPGRPRKTEVAGVVKRGPGRPRKTEVVAAAAEPARRRGRPPKAVSAGAGRVNGVVTLPSDAIENWSFWTQLVAFANHAAQQGKSLRITTDGIDVKVEASR